MFLALAMLFALAACGNSSTPAASDNSSASDGSSDTIKLGGIGALTGGYANYGLSVQHGAQLAVDEINAAGGVNGKQLELNFQGRRRPASHSLRLLRLLPQRQRQGLPHLLL